MREPAIALAQLRRVALASALATRRVSWFWRGAGLMAVAGVDLLCGWGVHRRLLESTPERS
jgi:hypothetical protein